MTKRKFTKRLRSLGVSESVIRNYANIVSKLGGKMSYKDVFDKLMGYLTQRLIYEYVLSNGQHKIDYKPYIASEFNFDDNMKNYLMHYCTVLNPKIVIKTSKI